ncbi:serine-threonine protein kinase 19-domain-containing protein [Bombardia bombarda]|uniref:Serine-threonine protein kinase 19-domain-containing protein n=1 Tax=Bombardia bombarda TaxID=252184 RepID=A0AA40C4E9_9PEZI|nr:serine-threonine protein kinase 19-domain-containing protein [Bombardia bombarda]
MSSLRSILGGSRIKKKSTSSTKPRASPSPSWTSSLPRTKSGRGAGAKKHLHSHDDADDDNDGTRLDDIGLARPLAASSPPRDVAQAQRYIRAHMFDPMPARAAGMSSTKIASVLQYRAALPPVASAAHIQTILSSSPTAAEREMAALVRAGAARRVVVPTRLARGEIGELLVLSADLEGLVRGDKGGLDAGTKERFVAWLRGNPAKQTMVAGEGGEGGLKREELDALVRAGFLTAGTGGGGSESGNGVYARPEDRTTMLSLERVAQAAAGSMAAVGGRARCMRRAGRGREGGGEWWRGRGAGGSFRVAVPGAGVFLKLVAGALAHLSELLQRTRYREMTEGNLREKWDGGVITAMGAGESEGVDVAGAKRARGEFAGILPGRTKKWREFNGLAFEWVLHEAVGAGLVEVFETKSVGRGIRLV